MASGINELSGESGCGKTQFCLRLALTAQNPVSVGGIDKCKCPKSPSYRNILLDFKKFFLQLLYIFAPRIVFHRKDYYN